MKDKDKRSVWRRAGMTVSVSTLTTGHTTQDREGERWWGRQVTGPQLSLHQIFRPALRHSVTARCFHPATSCFHPSTFTPCHMPTTLPSHPVTCTPLHLHTLSHAHPVTFTPCYMPTTLPSHPVTYPPLHFHTLPHAHPVTFTPCYMPTTLPSHPVTYPPLHFHTLPHAHPVTFTPCYMPTTLPSHPVTYPPLHFHTLPHAHPATSCFHPSTSTPCHMPAQPPHVSTFTPCHIPSTSCLYLHTLLHIHPTTSRLYLHTLLHTNPDTSYLYLHNLLHTHPATSRLHLHTLLHIHPTTSRLYLHLHPLMYPLHHFTFLLPHLLTYPPHHVTYLTTGYTPTPPTSRVYLPIANLTPCYIYSPQLTYSHSTYSHSHRTPLSILPVSWTVTWSCGQENSPARSSLTAVTKKTCTWRWMGHVRWKECDSIRRTAILQTGHLKGPNTAWLCSAQLSSSQNGVYALGKIHKRSIPSLISLRNVALKQFQCSSGWQWSFLVLLRKIGERFLFLCPSRDDHWCDVLGFVPVGSLKLFSISDLPRRKPLVTVVFPASLPARSFPMTLGCPGQPPLIFLSYRTFPTPFYLSLLLCLLFVRHPRAQTPTLPSQNPWLAHFLTLQPPHPNRLPQDTRLFLRNQTQHFLSSKYFS